MSLTARGREGMLERTPPVRLVVVAAAVSAAGLIPLAYIVLVSATTGLETVAALVLRPRVAELLANTVALVVGSVTLSVGIGVACAWLVERTVLPARRVVAVLLATPLVIPAFVTSYGWVTVVPSLAGLAAGILIATLAYYPLVYLSVAATLRRLDPTLEEVAAGLGLHPTAVFFRTILPQLRQPILGSGLLVGLHLLAEYGAFAMIRFETFTTAIVQQYRSTFSGPSAASLAGVLVFLCLLLLALESMARGRSSYARIGSGAARPAVRHDLGPGRWPVAGLPWLLVVFAVGVPVLSVVRWLGIGGASVWTEIHIASALVQTIGLAVAGATLAVVVAGPVALLAVRYPSRISRIVESIGYVGSSLPGIVIALALGTITLRAIPSLYQTVIVLVVAYVLLFLPRAVVNLRAGIAQVPPVLEDVASSLGKRPTVAFALVTARIAAPSALAGGALIFLGIVNELTATLLLGPNGTRTLAIQFWTHVNDLDYAQASPYALLMILLSVPMVLLLFRAVAAPVRRG